MHDIFGQGQRGRNSYGLRFVPCGTPELLDYRGAELLLIAAREGEEGLERSLGEGRGEGKGHDLSFVILSILIPFSLALSDVSEKETHVSIQQIFDELGLESGEFPAEAAKPLLEGSWI